MTDIELQSAVDDFFNRHLDKDFWYSLEAEKRSAAVSMAFNDISALIPGLTLSKLNSCSVAFKAVAEQSVYLARNYESMIEGTVVTSESVEGLSTGYSVISSNFGIAPRAEALILQAKRIYAFNHARLVRG